MNPTSDSQPRSAGARASRDRSGKLSLSGVQPGAGPLPTLVTLPSHQWAEHTRCGWEGLWFPSQQEPPRGGQGAPAPWGKWPLNLSPASLCLGCAYCLDILFCWATPQTLFRPQITPRPSGQAVGPTSQPSAHTQGTVPFHLSPPALPQKR